MPAASSRPRATTSLAGCWAAACVPQQLVDDGAASSSSRSSLGVLVETAERVVPAVLALECEPFRLQSSHSKLGVRPPASR